MSAAAQTDDDRWVRLVGKVLGWIAAVITFFCVWAAAVASVGWVFGIALGWIPAYLGALIAYAAFRFLWWLMLLAAVWIFATQI